MNISDANPFISKKRILIHIFWGLDSILIFIKHFLSVLKRFEFQILLWIIIVACVEAEQYELEKVVGLLNQGWSKYCFLGKTILWLILWFKIKECEVKYLKICLIYNLLFHAVCNFCLFNPFGAFFELAPINMFLSLFFETKPRIIYFCSWEILKTSLL